MRIEADRARQFGVADQGGAANVERIFPESLRLISAVSRMVMQMSRWVKRQNPGKATLSPQINVPLTETTMQFLDDSLLPENQQPLVIQTAPYGPEWIPADSTDIAVTKDQQVQKPVDCYNAARRCSTSTCARQTARAPSACRCSTSCLRACALPFPT